MMHRSTLKPQTFEVNSFDYSSAVYCLGKCLGSGTGCILPHKSHSNNVSDKVNSHGNMTAVVQLA